MYASLTNVHLICHARCSIAATAIRNLVLLPLSQMAFGGSHLRQVSMGDLAAEQDGQSGLDDCGEESFAHVPPLSSTSKVSLKRICSISIHEDIRHDVLVNLDHFLGDSIKAGDLMQIIPFNGASNTSTDSRPQSHAPSQGRSNQSYPDQKLAPSTANARGLGQNRKQHYPELPSDLGQRHVFAVKNMSSEQKMKQPECQVCCASLTIPPTSKPDNLCRSPFLGKLPRDSA